MRSAGSARLGVGRRGLAAERRGRPPRRAASGSPPRSPRSRPRRSGRSGPRPSASIRYFAGQYWLRERVPGAELVVLDDRVVEIPSSAIASATLPASCSNGNSGAWTPTIVSPSSRYSLVPGLQVGQGADAVDAGVGPEVDQHDPVLAAGQLGDRERLAVRRVEPLLRVGELGRGAVVGQLTRRPRPRRRSPLARAPWPPRTSASSSATALGLLELAARVDEQRGQVVGDRALELAGRGRRSSRPRPRP